MDEEASTVYDRIEKLEKEVAAMQKESKIYKALLHDKISKYEQNAIRRGEDVSTIL